MNKWKFFCFQKFNRQKLLYSLERYGKRNHLGFSLRPEGGETIMKGKWSAITKQIRDWVTVEEEGEEEEEEKHERHESDSRPYILQDDAIKKLKTAARSKNIPLDTAIAQAIDRYVLNTGHPSKPKISEQRKESNPLLRLEGLASRSLQKLSKGVTQHGSDEANYIR